MSKKIWFALILAVLFVLPSVALAQSPWGQVTDLKVIDIVKIFFGPGIPVAFTETPYKILQWLVFPFLALWMIIFGIMSEIRIFRRSQTTRIILTFLIAVMAAPTGALVWMVKALFALYGGFAFVVFIGMLFLGTVLWAIATARIWDVGGGWEGAGKRMQQQIKRQDKIRQLQRMAADRSLSLTKRNEAADEAMRLIKEEEEEIV